MKKRKRTIVPKLLVTAAVASASVANASTVYYVDDSISASGNGLSWSTPKKTIQEVYLLLPGAGDEIRIGQGTYKPSSSGTSIDLKTQVRILGGFAGYGAPNPDLRNPAAFVTTFDGDLGGGVHATHVVNVPSGTTPPQAPTSLTASTLTE